MNKKKQLRRESQRRKLYPLQIDARKAVEDYHAKLCQLSSGPRTVAEGYLKFYGSTVQGYFHPRSLPISGILDLDPRQLEELFDWFLPGLGSVATQCWNSLASGPHGSLCSPTPFRTLNRSDLTKPRQIKWFHRLTLLSFGYTPEVLNASSLAVWGAYISPNNVSFLEGYGDWGYFVQESIGKLLAVVIDREDSTAIDVWDTLCLTLEDRHPTGLFSEHLTQAMCRCQRDDGRELLKDYFSLTSDQLERAAILSSSCEASPEMIAGLLDETRQIPIKGNSILHSVWLRWIGIGLHFREFGIFDKSGSVCELFPELLRTMSTLLSSPLEVELASQAPDWMSRIMAAWAVAVVDSDRAIGRLQDFAQSNEVDCRWMALRILAAIARPESLSTIEQMLDDSNLLIALDAAVALNFWANFWVSEETRSQRWSLLCRLAHRINDCPAKVRKRLESNGAFREIEKRLRCCWGNESLQRLDTVLANSQIDPLEVLPPSERIRDDYTFNILLRKLNVKDSEYEPVYEGFTGSTAYRLLLNAEHSDGQLCDLLEKCLSAYHPFPSGLFAKVTMRPDESIRAIVGMLLEAKKPRKRSTALQIILQGNDSIARTCREIITKLPSLIKNGSKQETALATKVKNRYRAWLPKDTLTSSSSQNKLVLSSKIAESYQPEHRHPVRVSKATHGLILSLFEFVKTHEFVIDEARKRSKYPDKRATPILDISLRSVGSKSEEDWQKELDFLWLEWFRNRSSGARDADGRELVRAFSLGAAIYLEEYDSSKDIWGHWKNRCLDLSALQALQQDAAVAQLELQLYLRPLVRSVISRLFEHLAHWEDVAYLLDVAESICNSIPPEAIRCVDFDLNFFDANLPVTSNWLTWPARLSIDQMPSSLLERLFKLWRWMRQPHPDLQLHHQGLDSISLEAFGRGIASVSELIELMTTIGTCQYGHKKPNLVYENYVYLRYKHPGPAMLFEERLQEFTAALVREEVNRNARELGRYSQICAHFKYLEGYDAFELLLVAAGRRGVTKPTDNCIRQRELFSSMVSNLYPRQSETKEIIVSRLKLLLDRQQVSVVHLLQAALIAPQWADAIQEAVGWKSLMEIGAWLDWHEFIGLRGKYALAAWLNIENRTFRRDVESIQTLLPDTIQQWYEQSIHKRFPNEITGTVRDWFYSAFESLTVSQWNQLTSAMGEVTGKKSCQNALALISALKGSIARQELFATLRSTKKPVDLRPLALIPCTTDKERGIDLLERIRALDQYEERIKYFSHWENKEDEYERVQQALKLLAECAGFANVSQLSCFAEAAIVEEFKKYEVVQTESIQSRLVVDHLGMPGLRILRNGKPLKSLPSSVKNIPVHAEQTRLLKALKSFAVKARRMLEDQMVNKQTFAAADLAQMMQHPILKRMFAGLLFTDEAHVGILSENCDQLTSLNGVSSLAENARIRLAHPIDMVGHGGWICWRDRMRELGLVQPFQQIERGCYRVSDFPKRNGVLELVMPQFLRANQVWAIFRELDWKWNGADEVEKYYEAFKTFSIISIVPELFFDFSIVRFKDIRFTGRVENSYTTLDVENVPPLVFSESVRDLVIAVQASAYDGAELGVDDELIELRRLSLNEAIAQHGSTNIRWVNEDRLIVDNQQGSYEIDVRYAAVRMLPNQFVPLRCAADTVTDTDEGAVDIKCEALVAAIIRLSTSGIHE